MIKKKLEKLNIEGYSTHIILCVGKSCSPSGEGEAVWKFLKSELAARGLADSVKSSVFRTKASCLRVCQQGPIAVVYPEAVWYQGVTEQICRKILDEHVGAGKLVEENVLAKNSVICPRMAP